MEFKTVSSISDVETFCKNEMTDNSPFLNYYFFYLLETSGCTVDKSGWIPEHIIIKDKQELVGFIPNYKKLNSYGEYVFDQIFENVHYQIGQDYFPKYLSATPFTPVTRSNIFYGKKEILDDNFFKKLIKFLNERNISSLHLNYIEKDISDKLKNYDIFQRIGIQYHWMNKSYSDFSDFLESMKSRKRKNIIKERNYLKKKNIEFEFKTGNQISIEDIKNLFFCYQNTVQRKWGQIYLNNLFFEQLLHSPLLKSIIIISAYQRKEFLGCSLHFIGNNSLFGRYWGCTKEIPFLHFELCYYQAIEYAIKQKLQKVEAGAQGEHKISRGYTPSFTYSNHWFKNEKLQNPIRDFLADEKNKILRTADYLNKFSPFNES